MSRKKSKLIFGIGVNDSPDPVSKRVMINGKVKFLWRCPYYGKWTSMFARCYSEKELKKYPSYRGCSVSNEFKHFLDFKKWVDSQPNKDWVNCHLDKDLLVRDNRVYSPDTCVFVEPALNGFLTDSEASRGDHLIGVTYHKRDKVFEAKCNNPFGLTDDDGRYLGRFRTEIEAHLAWKLKKHEYACVFAGLQTDLRISEALRNLYKPD
jgi:hypothetical protein